MLVLRGEFGLAKKPRPTFGCPSVNHESGYVSDYKPFYANNTLCNFGVGNMTWKGQDYLESVRDNTRWGKIKKIAKEKGLPLMFDTVIDISKKLIIAAL